MWREGIFSFDTNVLLNIYRYTPDTRDRLFEILRRFNNRIWVPYQVAYEYHERRLNVISDQFKAAELIEAQLSKSFNQIENELRRYKNHPFANVDQHTQTIKEAVERAKVALHEAKSNHPNFIRSDQLLEAITELFNNKVGRPYPEPDLEKLYQDIDQRYEKKVPPGYEDAKDKKDEKKYGDAILWYQLIDHAKEENKPLVFVTGERKEDWWLRHEGETISPRRELLREIHSKANVLFYMYSTDQFMEQAEAFLGLHDHREAIDEIREIIQQDEANASRSVIPPNKNVTSTEYFDWKNLSIYDINQPIAAWSKISKTIISIGVILKLDTRKFDEILMELMSRDYISVQLYNQIFDTQATMKWIFKLNNLENVDTLDLLNYYKEVIEILTELEKIVEFIEN